MSHLLKASDMPPDLMNRMAGPKPPPDFEFDGATGAFDILLPIDARPAACFHDFFYSLGTTRADRAEADRLLYRNLRECRVGPIRAFWWWAAVRLFGGKHFNFK